MYYVTWQAVNAEGLVISGFDLIGDPQTLQDVLRAQGLELLVMRVPSRWWLAMTVAQPWRNGLEHVVILLRAHVPLYHALLVTADGVVHPYVKALLMHMSRAVGNGSSVANVCDAQADIIGSLYGQVCRVGMQTGMLAPLLQEYLELANFLATQSRRLHAQIFGPLLVLVTLLLLMVAGFFWVVPLVEQLYVTIGTPLPPLITTLAGLRTYPVGMVLVTVAVCLVLVAIAGARHPAGQYARDWLWYRIPVWGALRKSLVMSRWAWGLSSFLAQRLPLVQSMQMTELMADGPVMRKMLQDIVQELLKGKSLGQVITHYPDMFDASLRMVIATGLAGHRLEHVLHAWSQARMQQLETDVQKVQLIILLSIYGIIAACALAIMAVLYQPLWHMPGL